MHPLSRILCAVVALALCACDTTTKPAPAPKDIAAPVRPLTIQEQVDATKKSCQTTALNRGQWYRCWIPQAERIHEQMGYPNMDILKVHTSEMTMIAHSMENGTFSTEQGEAMVAQSILRFNNAVAERESKNRDREMESWRQFRQFMQSPY
jgi:hypothetical protein